MVRSPTLPLADPYAHCSRFYFALCRFSTTRGWMVRGERLVETRSGAVEAHGQPFQHRRTTAGRTARDAAAHRLRKRRNATLYFHDGDRVTIVASKRGAPEHPAWYHNLLHDPEVVFGSIRLRAEVAEDADERIRLWALADRVFPQYADYREQAAHTGRVIPIVQLVPR